MRCTHECITFYSIIYKLNVPDQWLVIAKLDQYVRVPKIAVQRGTLCLKVVLENLSKTYNISLLRFINGQIILAKL